MCNNRADLITKDNLDRPVDHNELDSCLWNDKCDYIELDHCTLNQNNYNLITMQLNICSILAHQHELSPLPRTLEIKGSRVDIVLLCETFLTCKTEKMVHIPGYKLIGILCILLNENTPYKRRQDPDIFEEGKVVGVCRYNSKNGRKIITGSMYKPPNADSNLLIDSIKNITTKARCNKTKVTPELITGIDHNLDLLKDRYIYQLDNSSTKQTN